MANKMCKRPGCGAGPFKGDKGLAMHEVRSHSPAGQSWKGAKRTVAKRRNSGGKEAIEEILTENPRGLGVQDINAEMRKRGHRVHANYVSQSVSTMSNVVRSGRGFYRLNRLKKQPQRNATGTSLVHEAQEEARAGLTLADMPREALALRIETLETQLKAVTDDSIRQMEAHVSLLRGVTNQ